MSETGLADVAADQRTDLGGGDRLDRLRELDLLDAVAHIATLEDLPDFGHLYDDELAGMNSHRRLNAGLHKFEFLGVLIGAGRRAHGDACRTRRSPFSTLWLSWNGW